MKLPHLTPSQWRSFATGTLAILATINQVYALISGTPGLHIPPLVTAGMQSLGLLVAMGSRSLNKRDSGTGTGIVGQPTSVAMPTVTVNGASPAPIAGLVPALLTALNPVGQMLLTAFAAKLLSEQHTAMATQATQQIDQVALAAGHAAIAASATTDAAKVGVRELQSEQSQAEASANASATGISAAGINAAGINAAGTGLAGLSVFGIGTRNP